MLEKLKAWWKHSETLFWADLQSAIGFLALALTYVDPAMLQPIIGDAKWFPWFVLANGIATRYLRKRGATDL